MPREIRSSHENRERNGVTLLCLLTLLLFVAAAGNSRRNQSAGTRVIVSLHDARPVDRSCLAVPCENSTQQCELMSCCQTVNHPDIMFRCDSASFYNHCAFPQSRNNRLCYSRKFPQTTAAQLTNFSEKRAWLGLCGHNFFDLQAHVPINYCVELSKRSE